MPRTIDHPAVIAAAGIVALIIAAGIGYLLAQPDREPELRDRVRAVCEQYAGLDLAGLAPLCADVGYQQTLDPTAWPYVERTMMPEDLDR